MKRYKDKRVASVPLELFVPPRIVGWKFIVENVISFEQLQLLLLLLLFYFLFWYPCKKKPLVYVLVVISSKHNTNFVGLNSKF